MEAMISFVDAYRDDHGVEPICRVLEIAPSTYHAHAARRASLQRQTGSWQILEARAREAPVLHQRPGVLGELDVETVGAAPRRCPLPSKG